MNEIESCISYSIAVFILVLITGCILNLLKRHFIMQLSGIAFFFTYFFFKALFIFKKYGELNNYQFYQTFFPSVAGISACLISMAFGFWIFPYLRKKCP